VFRAYFMTFFGTYRGHHHPHESPLSMTVPLIVLAVLSAAGGLISVPRILAPIFPLSTGPENITPMIISASFGILGILIAYVFYVANPALAETARVRAGGLYTLVLNKYYVDEVYTAFIVRPLEVLSRYGLWKGVDVGLIDGAVVDGGGHLVRSVGGLLRQLQSGSIRNYATWVMAGSLIVIFVLGLVGGSVR
jgi:NADH-quinone oxidoreductase subunit L